MNGEDINKLIKYLSTGKSLKVCILDNNSVEFLTWVNRSIDPGLIFNKYDAVLIPQWVWIEICDSQNRINYINNLECYTKVQVIREVDYSILVEHKEAELYYLFLYSCYNVSRIVSSIRKNILKGRSIEDLEPYVEWVEVFYDDVLDKRQLSNGTFRSKNAGELSICVLSYILSYYYNETIDVLTVFSNDRDTYDFISKAREMLYKDDLFSNRSNISITFKSNDFLIYEWTRLDYINEKNIDTFVQSYRQKRGIKFTRKKQDNSIEEQDILIDNEAFLELLKDNTVHLIF